MTNPADQPRKQVALPSASDLLKPASRPASVIAHPSWNEARETILALVTAGPARITILGPPGTGKTALLRDLAATFGERGRAACLLGFGDGPLDLGSAEIVLADEADRMSATRLDELRGRGDLAIVLAALPASRERFERYPDVTVVQLAPLSPEAARAFLVERLAQLGLPDTCLTEAAWGRLIVHGHGVPRLLIALLGLALFVAGEEHAEHVTGAHVEQAVEARGGGMEENKAQPARAEPDPARQSVPEIPASAKGASINGVVGWAGGAPPHRWRNRVAATAAMAAYLVSAAVLLAWGVHLQIRQTASPGPGAPAAVHTSLSTGDAPTQMAGTPLSISDASAPATNAQPEPPPSAGAATAQPQDTAATQPATIAVATKGLGAASLPPASADELPHRCSDGQWTWSSCLAHPSRVVWPRVRRTCVIKIGSLCLGAHYTRVH